MTPEEQLAAKRGELAILKREILEVRRAYALDVLAVRMAPIFVRLEELRQQAFDLRDEVAMLAAARTIRSVLRGWQEAGEHIKALTS